MEEIIKKHKIHWKNRSFITSTIIGLAMLMASFFANFYAGQFAVKKASNPVADLLLNNIPVINTNIIFSDGVFIFIILIFLLLLHEPRKIPFTLKSIAIFIFIRSAFMIMTHLGPFPDQLKTESNILMDNITFGADLFFSGHTGLPFLMALLFWDNKSLRYIFLTISIIAGIAVILGHLHYTIDVFAAFFITYSIYRLTQIFFTRDFQLFNNGLCPVEVPSEENK